MSERLSSTTCLVRRKVFTLAGYASHFRDGEGRGGSERKGMRSLLRDEWILRDAADQEIGLVREDSTGLALLRRFLTNLVPQRFDIQVMGQKVATVRQNFNPFVLKLTVDFTLDPTGLLDRRLGLAAVLLLCAVEGRQG